MIKSDYEKNEDEENTIYAEYAPMFQEYVYEDTGLRVPVGEPIGIEKNGELILLKNILYSED